MRERGRRYDVRKSESIKTGEKGRDERRTKEAEERDAGRSSFVLSHAILMRRTCYMEWNKGVAAEGRDKKKKMGGKKVASWREKEERRRAEY